MAYQVLSPDKIQQYGPGQTTKDPKTGAVTLNPGVAPIPGTTKTVGQPQGNTGSTTGQIPGQTPNGGSPGFRYPDMGTFGTAMNEIRSKLSANKDLTDQKASILKHLYDRPLTDQELKVLSPSQVSAIQSGQRGLIDMEVRLINDQLQGRNATLDQSINYMTGMYEKQKTEADTQLKEAQQTVLEFVQQFGSHAKEALMSLYGPEKINQLKKMGIDIDKFASLPTLSETKTNLQTTTALTKISAQYGTSTGGLDISIPSNTLAGKNNNPGNLRFTGQSGASQGVGGFAKFDSPQAGFQALVDDLTYKMTGQSSNKIPDGVHKGQKLSQNSTLEDLIRIYAPTADSNAPSSYAQAVATDLGISITTNLSQIDATDLATAMAKHESGTTVAVSQSDASINAQMLVSGSLAPSMISAYGGARNKALAEAKRLDPKFDPQKSELAYKAAQKWVQTQNSSQMTRFYGLATSVVNTIDNVNQLAEQMKNSGIPMVNKAKIQAYIQTQGNTPNGQLASQYMAAVNTLKEEFANLAQGGYAPTEAAWGLANSQINGNYGVDQLKASLTEVQKLINFRVNALQSISPVTPGGDPGTVNGPPTVSTDTQPESSVKSVNDKSFQTSLHAVSSRVVTSKSPTGNQLSREKVIASLKQQYPGVSPKMIEAIVYKTYPDKYR